MSHDGRGTDKRGASYLHNLLQVYELAVQSEYDAITAHLGTLHYNEIRKIKVKLTSLVEGHTEPVGRKKPELIESVVSFFRERKSVGDFEALGASIQAITGGEGAPPAPKKKSRRSSKRSRRELDEEQQEEQEQPVQQQEEPEDDEAEEDAGDQMDLGEQEQPAEQHQAASSVAVEKPRKRIKQAALGSLADSMIDSISRNEFSVSNFDLYFLPQCGLVAQEEQLVSLGAALSQNTHLRSLVLPHLSCGHAAMESVMRPTIESGGSLGLETLDLRYTDMTRKTSATLASFLAQCPLLKELRLEGNKLGDKLEFLKTAPASLSVLSIGNLTDKAALVLAKWVAGAKLNSLTIEGQLKEDTLKRLAKGITEANTLEMVRLESQEPLSESVAKALLQCASLVYACGSGAQCDALQRELVSRAQEGLEGHPSALLREFLLSHSGYNSVSSREALSTVMRLLAAQAVVPLSAPLDGYSAGPLELACTYWGDGRMTSLLLSAPGASANELGASRRNLAARAPKLSPQNLRALLEAGMQADARDATQVPLLVAAATYAWQSSKGNDAGGWFQRVQLLLNAGAQVDAADGDGETALSVFSRTPYWDLVGLLLSSGADIQRVNSQGSSPLHCACRYGHPETVSTLISHHADINARDKLGDTPLDVATFFQHGDVVALLKNSGAEHGVSGDEPAQFIADTDASDEEHQDCVIF